MKNKVIGIPGWKTGDNSFGIGVSYAEFLSQFGSVRILMPGDAEQIPELDLLVLSGGADVLPTTYGAAPSFRIGTPN